MTPEALLGHGLTTLAEDLDDYGEVIYSSGASLRKGDIYLLGLNPGGPDKVKIGDHLKAMLTRGHNAYVDEEWESGGNHRGKGQDPLQRRVVGLLTELGYTADDVCASNLIFKTTRTAAKLFATKKEWEQSALRKRCWAFHEKVIELVQPKLLLVFGNGECSPYAHLREVYPGPDDTPIPAQHGSWRCRRFQAVIHGRNVAVVGLPHLSRYDPTGKPEVVNWIKEAMPSP